MQDAAAEMLTGLLVKRLRLVDDRKQHPEIAEEVITAPVFIVGQPALGLDAPARAARVRRGCPRAAALGDVGAVAAAGAGDVRHRSSDRGGAGGRRRRCRPRCSCATRCRRPGRSSATGCSTGRSSTRRGWRRTTSPRTASGSSTPTTRPPTRRTAARCSSCSGATRAGGCSSTRSTCSRSTRCSPPYPDAVLIWTHRDPAAVLPSVVSLTGYMRRVQHARLRPRAVRGASGW